MKWISKISLLVFMLPGLATAQDDKAETSLQKAQRNFLLRQILTASDAGPVAKDLELTDYQQEMLKDIRGQYAEKSKAMMGVMQEAMTIQSDTTLGEKERRTKLRSVMKERDKKFKVIVDELVVKMEEALLPHQIKRLKQIALQKQLLAETKGDQFEMVLRLGDQLELKPREKTKLKTDIAKAKKEYQEELKKLHQKYQKRILDSMPPESQEKLKEILGDMFSACRG